MDGKVATVRLCLSFPKGICVLHVSPRQCHLDWSAAERRDPCISPEAAQNAALHIYSGQFTKLEIARDLRPTDSREKGPDLKPEVRT